jgi:hypothetical protein
MEGDKTSPSASWAENAIITECTQESGHLQSTELSARLDLFKKLGMMWKDRSNRANFIRKNP